MLHLVIGFTKILTLLSQVFFGTFPTTNIIYQVSLGSTSTIYQASQCSTSIPYQALPYSQSIYANSSQQVLLGLLQH